MRTAGTIRPTKQSINQSSAPPPGPRDEDGSGSGLPFANNLGSRSHWSSLSYDPLSETMVPRGSRSSSFLLLLIRHGRRRLSLPPPMASRSAGNPSIYASASRATGYTISTQGQKGCRKEHSSSSLLARTGQSTDSSVEGAAAAARQDRYQTRGETQKRGSSPFRAESLTAEPIHMGRHSFSHLHLQHEQRTERGPERTDLLGPLRTPHPLLSHPPGRKLVPFPPSCTRRA